MIKANKQVVILGEKPSSIKALSRPFPHEKVNYFCIKILPCDMFPSGATVISSVGVLAYHFLAYVEDDVVFHQKLGKFKKELLSVEELSSLYDQLFTEELLYHWNYLKDELNKATCIINACDPGELGETFFELFYKASKTSTKELLRLSANTYVEQDILNSLNDLSEIKGLEVTEEYMQPLIEYLSRK